jgi:hypothetical protein
MPEWLQGRAKVMAIAALLGLFVIILVVVVVLAVGSSQKGTKVSKDEEPSISQDDDLRTGHVVARYREAWVADFCSQHLPHIGDIPDDTYVRDSLPLAMIMLLLPGCDVTCPQAPDTDKLIELRRQSAQALNAGDDLCKGEPRQDFVEGRCAYRKSHKAPPRTFMYLRLADLLAAVRALMLHDHENDESGQSYQEAKNRVRTSLIVWRSVAGYPYSLHGSPRLNLKKLAVTLYDVDSCIRFLVSDADGLLWIHEEERQAYLNQQKQRIILSSSGSVSVSATSFLQALQACTSMMRDGCFQLVDTIHRWHRLQGLPVPPELTNEVRLWPKRTADIVPLQWYDMNCYMQAAILALAPVRPHLDFDLTYVPWLQALLDQGRTEPMIANLKVIYQELLHILDLVNSRLPGSPPLGFQTLHDAIFAERDSLGIRIAGDNSRMGDAKVLLRRFIYQGTFRTVPVPSLLASPFGTRAYFLEGQDDRCWTFTEQHPFMSYPTASDWTLQPSALGADMLGWFPLALLSHRPQAPFFFSGPKLWLLQVSDASTLYFTQPACDWSFAVQVGDGEFWTLRYVLRSAIMFSTGHYASILHYGSEATADDAWYFCTFSSCTRLSTPPLADGTHRGMRAVAMIYERVD